MASTKSSEEEAPSSAASSAPAAASSFAGFPTARAPASSSAPVFPGLGAAPLVRAQPPLFGTPPASSSFGAAPASSLRFGGGYVALPPIKLEIVMSEKQQEDQFRQQFERQQMA